MTMPDYALCNYKQCHATIWPYELIMIMCKFNYMNGVYLSFLILTFGNSIKLWVEFFFKTVDTINIIKHGWQFHSSPEIGR